MVHFTKNTQWWVSWNGDPKGPLSTKQVRQWLKEGKINRDSFVKAGCDGKWVLVAKVGLNPDFHEIFGGLGTGALVLFLLETVFLWGAYPHLVPWFAGFIVAYTWLMYRVFGLPKTVKKAIEWVKYHFF